MEKHIKELMNEFEQMLRENPDKVVEYTEHLYKHNPDAVRKMLMTYEDNGHIRDKKTYDELVDYLEWSNKQGYGEKWSLEKIKKKGIKIIFIPNSFVKNYEYIVDIIISSKNADIPIQQTLFD